MGQSEEEIQAAHDEETKNRIITDIFRCVLENPGSTKKDILDAVTGDTTALLHTFNELVNEGHLIKSGEGLKGSPFTYTLSPAPVAKAA